MENDQLVKIFNFAEEYLEKIRPADFDILTYSGGQKPLSTIDEIFMIMCRSLQNKAIMSKVIKFKKNKEDLDAILYHFDPTKILDNYEENSLYDRFKVTFAIKNPENNRNMWVQYAKYIISASRFVVKYKTAHDFNDFVLSFQKNDTSSMALPLLLKKEIKGMGFALACDFLKEIGYVQYPKPDTHLIDVFSAFNICEKDQYEVYEAIIRMAEACGKTPFYVDKVFWLICSGNFPGGPIPGQKEQFIEAYKDNIWIF